MPNYCYNDLTLTAATEEAANNFEEFLQSLSDKSATETEDTGLLSYFLKRPSDEVDWYSWNCEKWGTKWDVYYTEWERAGLAFYLRFDTAWAPPVSLYEHIYENMGDTWEVLAMYSECGMQFVGKFEDGFDESYEYDFTNEDWRDEIPEDLIDFAGLDTEYEGYLEWNEEE
jgi:hypothetical protein